MRRLLPSSARAGTGPAGGASATGPPTSRPAPDSRPGLHSGPGPASRTAAASGAAAETGVPWLLRAAAGWSWRVLVIGAAVYVLLQLLVRLRVIALSVIGALLLTALIHPLFRRVQRLGLPRAAAAGITLLVLVLGLTAVVALLSGTTAAQLPELRSSVSTGIGQVRDWLSTGPLGLDAGQLDRLYQQVVDQLNANRQRLATGALSGASLAAEVLGGALLALFATFFFLYDGPGIWAWIAGLFGRSARDRVHGAGAVAWQTLTGYIRGTILVALVDAVFIGLGLLLVGVPLVAPLVVLTFLAAFIPVAGAVLAGAVAVLVALVSKGFVAALIIFAVVLAVQQIEGNILQPLVLGKSVQLHPLAITIAITAGATVAGVPGAVIAVPLVAVINRVAVYLLRAGSPDHTESTAAAQERPGPLADTQVPNTQGPDTPGRSTPSS